MTATPESRWIRFLRTYGPIPTNDNMYDEKIQGALRRHKIEPIQLPTQFLQAIVENFRSVEPISTILTGTAGDGKTFHCREAWVQLGGSPKDWKDRPVQELSLGEKKLFFVKDLSELKEGDGEQFVVQMAADVMDPAAPRLYLVAANHGQLLEKFKASPQTDSVKATKAVIEEILVSGENPDPSVRLILHDLSQAPAAEMVVRIVAQLTGHPGWTECDLCPVRSSGTVCPIFENRRRLTEGAEAETLRQRLAALIELSEQNGVHFSIRQLLALGANMLLGHPDAKDGLMSCKDIPQIVGGEAVHLASVYRNVFGENLVPRQAERTPVFKKLNSFGIGAETNNLVDNLLVYGGDDPAIAQLYQDLVLSDPIYGGTPAYRRAQRDYLEGGDESAREAFLPMLRSQRQRLFFVVHESRVTDSDLWDLTVFRYGGLYLELCNKLRAKQPPPRTVMPLIMRGLNRVFSGMLLQNQDELVLATSGSHSQSKTSPLLDAMISVPRERNEEILLGPTGRGGVSINVRVSKGDDPGVISLVLTPTRFEFLGRVAEGALPSSFSLECHEDLLAFKALLLSATERRRELDDYDVPDGELVLRFIEVGADGRAKDRRVMVRN